MAKKIFLSPSNQSKNYYAAGNTTEAVQCGRIANATADALKRCGFAVKIHHYGTMAAKVASAESWGADLYLPIHTNAFNGKVSGTRLFYYSTASAGYKACQAIFKTLAPVTPGTSENIKAYPGLYEVKYPSAPVVYIEADFHDVPSVARWIIDHVVDIGEAICKGVCNYYGVKYVSPVVEEPEVEEKEEESSSNNTAPALYDSIDEGDILEFTGSIQYSAANGTKSKAAKAGKVKVTKKYLKTAKHPIHVRTVNESGEFISGTYGWVDLADLSLVFSPYTVKVLVDSLDYRSGPGTDYKVVGTIKDKGVYTIVQEKDGWGQLKSKVGWILLENTKKR